jgi:uncharacterized Ntn-hydrolase superfamily protein
MHKLVLTLVLFFNSICCFATWSIIIVNPQTKEIGIAAASCTYSVYGIGGIVPGKGAVVAQARSNMKAKARAMEMIRQSTSPDKILFSIIDSSFDPNSSFQQYGIVSLDYLDKPVTFTGSSTPASKGSFTSEGISVQGNTLANEMVLRAIFDTALVALKNGLSMEETLMKALQAGADAGGDKRCGLQKASSAFITVMKPTDNAKRPYLNLFVSGIAKGGKNAVNVLESMFARWKTRKK